MCNGKINYSLIVARLFTLDSKAQIAREVGVDRQTLENIIDGGVPTKDGFADTLIAMAREYFTNGQLIECGIVKNEDIAA